MTEYVPATARGLFEEDLPFIYHSWLKSYRGSWTKGKNPTRFMDKDTYYDGHKELIRDLIEESVTLVAHNPDDADQIFGYIVGALCPKGLCIHYLFVKQPFRRFGIATMLVSELKRITNTAKNTDVYASHGTGIFHDVLGPKYGIHFDPYLIYRFVPKGVVDGRCG